MQPQLPPRVCYCYQPSGFVENRHGTVSDFCLLCGQPADYHRKPEAMHWGNPKTGFGTGTAPQKEVCAFVEEVAWRFGRHP